MTNAYSAALQKITRSIGNRVPTAWQWLCWLKGRSGRARSMSDLSVHFSSATPQWGTPQAFFDKLDAEFHFQTDVCAEEWNAKCARYFTPEIDGLKQEWAGMCWMNPPYGREIPKWVEKAYRSA